MSRSSEGTRDCNENMELAVEYAIITLELRRKFASLVNLFITAL